MQGRTKRQRRHRAQQGHFQENVGVEGGVVAVRTTGRGGEDGGAERAAATAACKSCRRCAQAHENVPMQSPMRGDDEGRVVGGCHAIDNGLNKQV